MKESIISRLWHTLFGYKYYLPIFVDKGGITTRTSATPFRTRKAAQQATIGLTAYVPVEIISFRSRIQYDNGVVSNMEVDQDGTYRLL